MSTTVRIVAEVELTVDAWDSKSSFDSLAVQAVREGKQILNKIGPDVGFHLIGVKEVKFVTHSIAWDKESV